MCYICSCFGWIIDLIQRALTFCLACVMSCVVCFGLAVVVAAGIAYGYNYMMAEFLTLARSDVFVYIRRGQFYEKADLKPTFARRAGGGAKPNELFSSNSSDYQDTKPMEQDIKPLPNTWRKAIDRRNYAENLVSFTGNIKNESIDNSAFVEADKFRPTLPPSEQPLEATVVLIRGPPTATPKPIRTSLQPEKDIGTDKLTTIVMRKFYPNPQITMLPEVSNEDEFYQDADRPVIDHKPKQTDGGTDWPLQRKRKVLKRRKPKSHRLSRQELKPGDYGPDEEEDDVAYKPV